MSLSCQGPFWLLQKPVLAPHQLANGDELIQRLREVEALTRPARIALAAARAKRFAATGPGPEPSSGGMALLPGQGLADPDELAEGRTAGALLVAAESEEFRQAQVAF